MNSLSCFCGLDKPFSECCQRYIRGYENPLTALDLMRSRYAAYASHSIDYLINTTHFSQRQNHSKKDTLEWAITNLWLKLELIACTENTVEFKAYYRPQNTNIPEVQIHHEKSTFVLENGIWYYLDGIYF